MQNPVVPIQPSQYQIDQIASFVEAARELKCEPFFHPDEKRSIRSQGNDYTFEVGDRFHFRSALVTFRRIWMNDEPSNFLRCCGIMRRFQPTAGSPFLEEWRREALEVINGSANFGLPASLLPKVKSRELIDLWLNAVFAHVSIKRPNDQRHQFEAYLKVYGQASMEYAFRDAVWKIGIQVENTRNHGAEQFLEYWDSTKGIGPSFQIGAPFGEKLREITPQGHVLIRKGSSKFHNEESVESMFERVVSRNQHRDIKNVVEMLGVSLAQRAKIVFWSETVEEMFGRAGKPLQIEEIDFTKGFPQRPSARSYSSLFDFQSNTKSAVMSDDSKVITNSVGVTILNRALQILKKDIQKAARE